MRRALAVVACMLAAASGSRAGAGDEPERVAELAWASGPREAYDGQVVTVTYDGGAMAPGSIPFGPGCELRYGSAGGGVEALLLDRDFDGSLTDEEPVEFETDFRSMDDVLAGRRSEPAEEATIRVHPPWAREAGLQDGVRVHLRLGAGRHPTEFVCVPLLHLEGHVVAGGRRRALAVYDGNHDLCFDDPAEDRVFLDVDGDGALCRHACSHERILPGRPVRVREETLVAEIDAAHRRVRFLPGDGTPYAGCPWEPEALPPAGTTHEGKARPLEEIRAEYDEKRSEIKRRHGGAVLLTDLVTEAGRLGTPEAFELLELAYRQNDSVALRRTVIEAMGDVRYGDHASVLLALAGRAREPDLRLAAVHALHAMDAPGRDDVLLKIAKTAKDDGTYRTAVRYAAATGTEAAQSGLIVLLGRCGRDPDRALETYRAATRVLGSPPTEDLLAKAFRTKSPGLHALALLDARALPYPAARDHALAFARSLPEERSLREAVIEVLGGVGDAPSVGALLGWIPGLEPGERERVTALLGADRDPEATAALLDALDAPCPATRALAAGLLPSLQVEDLGRRLVDRLAREQDPAVLEPLARAVGAADAREAVGALLDVLRRPQVAEPVAAACITALLVVGWDDPPARARLEQTMRDGGDGIRLRVVDAAAARASRETLPILRQGLGDARWPVRIAAARGLGDLRTKDAVPALIGRLEAEERRLVRNAVADALRRTTGLDLSDAARAWRSWWEAEGPAFRVPAEAPAPRETDPSRVLGTFYGVPVLSDHCAFVLDRSSSMDGDPGALDEPGTNLLQRAVRETLRVADALPDGAFLDVILFDTWVHPWQKALVPLDAEARGRLKTFLGEQAPSGGSNLHDALIEALGLPEVDTVYLLTDGAPTEGRHVLTDEILASADEANRDRRVTIHGIAIDHDSVLLRRLAAASGGTYVRR